MVYEIAVVSARQFPWLAARAPLPNTLYAFFQQAYACTVIRAEERVSAAPLPAEAASALGLPEATPALHVERRTQDVLDRVVELRISLCATEDYRYHIVLA